jgi:hypothetical protein
MNVDMIVVLVHGTWARNTTWIREGSSLRRALSDALGSATTFEAFKWSGRNSFRARHHATLSLRMLLLEVAATTDDPILVIAHSHGGNIAFEAVVGNAQLRHHCRVVTISTPFIVSAKTNLTPSGIQGACLLISMIVTLGVWCLLLLLAVKEVSVPDGLLFPIIFLTPIISITVLWGVVKSQERYARSVPMGSAPSHNVDMLIVRSQGDEASMALSIFGLASFLLSVAWALDEKLRSGAQTYYAGIQNRITSKVTLGRFSRIALFLCTIFATESLGGLVGGLVVRHAGRYILYVMIAMALLLWRSTIRAMLLPVIVLLNCGFGFDAVRYGPFIRLNAESAPAGEWRLVQRVYEVGGLSLQHGRPYDDPGVHALISRWIQLKCPAVASSEDCCRNEPPASQ